jgi:hypothetical protein
MPNANAETGYLSKAYRGGSKIEHVQSFVFPQPTTAAIPMPELEQVNNVVPEIGGSITLGTLTITCVASKGATVQDAIEAFFWTGDKTPEDWSCEDCNPSTGTAERTYDFVGYLEGVQRGPFETAAGKLLVITIHLTESPVVSVA